MSNIVWRSGNGDGVGASRRSLGGPLGATGGSRVAPAERRGLPLPRLSWVVLACVSACGVAWGQNEPAETYFFNTLGLGGGEKSFKDTAPGDDMLPYTEDDMVLPEYGNLSGTWSQAHHDINSDGAVQEDEHIFTLIRREDDDFCTFSAMSRPEYGVLYEAEDWWDYHDARNSGPSASIAFEPLANWLDAAGSDFEHNDRPDWEGESNAFLYNNLRANQHGKGNAKYYFELINPSNTDAIGEDGWTYDEVEGFEKRLNFQHNFDDPTTAFNETGDCRREYMRTTRQVMRGYMIPVEDLAGLEDGSLPTLFGWEEIDLAAYFRDTIAPMLEEEALNIYAAFCIESGLCLPSEYLPPTHIALLQIEAPIEVNVGGTCSVGQAQAQAMADVWGLPSSGATYRVSHLLGLNADVHNDALEGMNHPWIDRPEDESERNLWLLDHFFRDDDSHIGKYAFAGPGETTWTIVLDPAFTVLDRTNNKVLLSDGAGVVMAPLPRGIGENERPVEVVVDLAQDVEGPGVDTVQIGLHSADAVLAYAELTPDGATLHLGGELDAATGLIGNPTTSSEQQGEPLFGQFEEGEVTAEYTRFLLQVTTEGLRLSQEIQGEYVPNDFNYLGEFSEEIATAAFGGADLGGDVARVSVYVSAPCALSTLAVFAGPPSTPSGGGQVPADCNQDGNLDLSDGICLLGHLFLGNPDSLPCGDGTVNDAGNIALMDSNGDENLDLSDAVGVFGYLFLGQPPPTACTGPTGDPCDICVPIKGCPEVCE